jgi:hypothetical protein
MHSCSLLSNWRWFSPLRSNIIYIHSTVCTCKKKLLPKNNQKKFTQDCSSTFYCELILTNWYCWPVEVCQNSNRRYVYYKYFHTYNLSYFGRVWLFSTKKEQEPKTKLFLKTSVRVSKNAGTHADFKTVYKINKKF